MYAKELKYGFVVLTLVGASLGQAQQSHYGDGAPPVEYHPTPPLPPDFGYTHHHDSTAAGNWLRGWAAVLHGTGSYWLSMSQATILFEYAEALDQFNGQQRIELRKFNSRAAEAERQQCTRAHRAKHDKNHDAKYEAAFKLTEVELDRTTGRIAWPAALLEVEHKALRLQLDALFCERAAGNVASDSQAAAITRTVETLRQTLRKRLVDLPSKEYHAAQKFLCGLKYEPTFTPRPNEATPAAAQTASAR